MPRSLIIRDCLTFAAMLLVGVLILIAVWGVIVRHAKEHGHYVPGTHASVPCMQRGEAGCGGKHQDVGHARIVLPSASQKYVRGGRS